jgi:bifunctional non-homologous end joining protein LigD
MKKKIDKGIVEITNPDRILFPKSKITKSDLIDYYECIADIMIPYMQDRPLTMVRYPSGITKEGFYQKDMPEYFPDWIKNKTIKKGTGGITTYVVCNNPATLVYLANQAVITPHLWLSKIDKLDYPDMLIFDLDPPEGTSKFSLVRAVAFRLKEILESLDLVPFVKTTGSKGLHIVVPLKRTADFETVRAAAQTIAQCLVNDDPKHLTLEVRKEKRRGRVFIDTLRNAYAQTVVAPYGVRPIEKAPIATPILWDEVADKKLTAQRYTIKNIFTYLEKHGDVWQGMNTYARSIKNAVKNLVFLGGIIFCFYSTAFCAEVNHEKCEYCILKCQDNKEDTEINNYFKSKRRIMTLPEIEVLKKQKTEEYENNLDNNPWYVQCLECQKRKARSVFCRNEIVDHIKNHIKKVTIENRSELYGNEFFCTLCRLLIITCPDIHIELHLADINGPKSCLIFSKKGPKLQKRAKD